MSEKIKYANAIKEVEQIISDLKNDTVDVDELASKTQKALSLIKMCNDKIKNTEFEVKKIIDEIEKD